MKKLIFLFIVLAGCNSKPGIDGNEFLGKWVISESSPGYSKESAKIEIEISKKDIFFWVSIKFDGKDFMDEAIKDSATENEKQFAMLAHQFQLSPDKQTLLPVTGQIEGTILYNDDNKTIQTRWGWFVKK